MVLQNTKKTSNWEIDPDLENIHNTIAVLPSGETIVLATRDGLYKFAEASDGLEGVYSWPDTFGGGGLQIVAFKEGVKEELIITLLGAGHMYRVDTDNFGGQGFAFRSSIRIYAVCSGGPGNLWVCRETEEKGSHSAQLVELCCSYKLCTDMLRLSDREFCISFQPISMCYVDTNDSIVTCDGRAFTVACVSCGSGEMLWQTTHMDDHAIFPSGVVYDKKRDVLFVSDGIGPLSRILVLCPSDGSHLSTVPYSHIGNPRALALSGDQLVVLSKGRGKSSEKTYVTFFSLEP